MAYFSEQLCQQQQSIINSCAKYKLIEGCAGCGKTSVLISCTIHDLNVNKRPILYLTKVGSVTDEFMNRLKYKHGIEFNRVNETNHYVGYSDDNIPICVTTIDAWVHHMLTTIKGTKWLLFDEGGKFGKKINVLYTRTSNENITCSMKVGSAVELLIIDESQDFSEILMQIIINLSRNDKNKKMDIYIAGDRLQSLIPPINSTDVHPHDVFNKINPSHFTMNVCVRCPKAHIDFNNVLLFERRQCYGIPTMCSANENCVDKPLLFAHGPMSEPSMVDATANLCVRMIEFLLVSDSQVVPGNIVFIMRRLENNAFFKTLNAKLDALYVSFGYVKGRSVIMSTRDDASFVSLKWKGAEDKSKLLSVCGIKGKESRVVFLLGITAGSMPHKNSKLGEEIYEDSNVNVGTTRSTKYLICGFAEKAPSKYLYECHNDLAKHAYIGYAGADSNENIPEPYNKLVSMCESHPNIFDKWKKAEFKFTKIGKYEFQVKDDISRKFESVENLIPGYTLDTRTINKRQFGNIQVIRNIEIHDNNTNTCLLGLMGEVLINRKINRQELFNKIRRTYSDNNIYTDDEELLSCMYDIRIKKKGSQTIYCRSP